MDGYIDLYILIDHFKLLASVWFVTNRMLLNLVLWMISSAHPWILPGTSGTLAGRKPQAAGMFSPPCVSLIEINATRTLKQKALKTSH